jgi:hypothetical protein
MKKFDKEKNKDIEEEKSKVMLLLFWTIPLLVLTIVNVSVTIEQFDEYNVYLTALSGAAFLSLAMMLSREYSVYKKFKSTQNMKEIKEVEEIKASVNYNPNIPISIVVIIFVILIIFVCTAMYSYYLTSKGRNINNNTEREFIDEVSEDTDFYRIDDKLVKNGDSIQDIKIVSDYRKLNSKVFIYHSVSGDKILSTAVAYIMNNDINYVYDFTYEDNISFVNNSFGESNCEKDEDNYYCSKDGINLQLNRNGVIKVSDNEFVCEINENNESFCKVKS